MIDGVLLEKVSAPTYDEGDQIDASLDMNFEGEFGQIVDEVDKAIRNKEKINFWHPGRLLRGVVDYKIDREETVPYARDLVRNCTKIVLDIYQGNSTEESFSSNAGRLASYSALSSSLVIQHGDEASATASNPKFSQGAAETLHNYLQGADILFIPLGHGGTIPGLMTFNYYAELQENGNSVVYPVRFSREKRNDTKPCLSYDENEYLEMLADGRKVVVFDEDIFSGRTLHDAVRFFSHLFDQDVVPLANVDAKHAIGAAPVFLGTRELDQRLNSIS